MSLTFNRTDLIRYKGPPSPPVTAPDVAIVPVATDVPHIIIGSMHVPSPVELLNGFPLNGEANQPPKILEYLQLRYRHCTPSFCEDIILFLDSRILPQSGRMI